MSLKFNPSLCNDEVTDKLCRNILRRASFRITDIMLDTVSTKIQNLKSEKVNVLGLLRRTLPQLNLTVL